MKNRKIIYVNFAPYDNTGRFLDFLIENNSIVIHFSFDHLRVKNGRRSHITMYKNGKPIFKKNLLWLRTHPLLLFPSLPFVALAMFAETLMYSFRMMKKEGKFDTFLTVNAYPAVTGLILKKLGIVDKTIFWVWDYFPTNFPDWRMRIIRKVYLRFDTYALKHADKVVFLNRYLKKARENQGIHFNGRHSSIIPIGTNPSNNIYLHKQNILGQMGLIKESQGLDLLFQNLDLFFKKFPKLKIEIIGSGPEEEKYKRLAKKYRKKITFHGFMEKADEIDKLIQKWKIGIATYVPVKWSEHYWGDPSKIKAYISRGIPVVTTAVPEFSKEITKHKAGIVIPYDKDKLFEAFEKIIKKELMYAKNARKLAEKYYYKRLYKKLLD